MSTLMIFGSMVSMTIPLLLMIGSLLFPLWGKKASTISPGRSSSLLSFTRTLMTFEVLSSFLLGVEIAEGSRFQHAYLYPVPGYSLKGE